MKWQGLPSGVSVISGREVCQTGASEQRPCARQSDGVVVPGGARQEVQPLSFLIISSIAIQAPAIVRSKIATLHYSTKHCPLNGYILGG